MGRSTGGVKGMNVSRGDNWVLAMDVARDDTELLVVTDNGYGKRTLIQDYPRKGRGSMGVKTISLTEKKGGLVGALIVQERDELVFISREGMVQRTSVSGISRYGRASQGVKLMNIREDDVVSAVALVMEDSASAAPEVAELPDAEGGPVGDPVDVDVESLEGAAAGEIDADDASDAAHGEGAEPRGTGPVEDDE
jgi:DNA gyrase subunit A